MLPAAYMLQGEIEISGEEPHASGGFGEVWVGSYKGQKVAIKALKTYGTTSDRKSIKKVSTISNKIVAKPVLTSVG